MTQAGSELEARKDLTLTQAITSEGWKPQTFDDLRQVCTWIASSRLAPRGFDTPEKVFIGCQTAMEAGLPMLSGLRMLYVVHNVPAWLGKGALALIRSKGVCDEPPVLRYEGEGNERRAVWRFKRKDMPLAVEVSYSWGQAVRAGYDKKEGAWQSDPDGMLSWRGVSRMGDRYFSDVLCGLDIFEAVRDYPPEAFERSGVGELPTGEPAADQDPLMVGAGQPSTAEDDSQTHDSLPAEPAPTSTIPGTEPEDADVIDPAPEGDSAAEELECEKCGTVDLYGPASDYLCTACGHDVRTPHREEPPDLPTFTPALLVKMLGRLKVKVTQKTVKAWTDEQQVAAYNWAFSEQMALDAEEAKVQYDKEYPDKPEFLPGGKPAAEPAKEPEKDAGSQVSEFSTPGGSCITTRQAGVLRGLAQNRCIELGLKEPDARMTFTMEALGCAAEEVTEDKYEEAKEVIRVFAPEF